MKAGRWFIILLFLSFYVSNLMGSHIVGGGIYYKYIEKNKYVVKLEYYRDCSAGAADFPPANLKIGIYANSNNQLVNTLELIPGPIIPVNFLVGYCVSSPVTCVQKRVYEDTLLIDTSIFKDALGYYFSYEQCCRNFGIKNIIDPDKSGMTFYAEFPHVYKNNAYFINSSAELLNEQNLYLCVNEPFEADYSFYDTDGDKLIYSLVDPLKGNTDPVINNGNGITVINPKPYPVVDWQTGYGSTNYLDGNPDIKIDSNTGILSLIPKQAGIYIFAIKIEEYRDGIKISEVRREVQYQIIICPTRTKPEITWTNSTENVLKANAKKCLTFLAKDIDPTDSLALKVEEISQQLLNQSLTISIDSTQKNNLQLEVCIDLDCSVLESNTEGFRISVSDRSCPVAKTDTFLVNLNIESLKAEDPLANIPNVFTPNGDGKNDRFSIHNNYPISCIQDFSIKIYNRWGETIYISESFNFEWTGLEVPAGVYFYVIKLENREKIGHLSLMR